MTEKKDGECIKRAFVRAENNKARLIAVMDMAGIMVISALLLSGLSLISSHQQPVIAQQQNITNGDGVTGGDANIIENTTSTTGSAAQGGNATGSAGGAGGNQSELRMHLEEARTALQNDNTEDALIHLDLALNVLGGAGGIQGNITTDSTIADDDATNTNNEDSIPTVGGTSAADEDSECGAVSVGGTSAADDYGCPPDPDA
ncbi:MAG: hypothetical protein M3251_05795 [Thermoproteota archaeon]|nr:hypothetical protein [Thermoproteota archaeon]MDQ3888769.1 hypothetical protein [Thermoproteota archaeon]